MFASWEMQWLCKGEMIKRLLVAFVPKHNVSGITWWLLQNNVHHSQTNFGQISFREIVEGLGPQCLGRRQCASRCNITDGEG